MTDLGMALVAICGPLALAAFGWVLIDERIAPRPLEDNEPERATLPEPTRRDPAKKSRA